jgi:hypothetical protein
MRLAEKPDDMAENTPVKDDDVPPDGKTMVVFAEKPKASPPASLSANLIPRRENSWGGVRVDQIEQQAMPGATQPAAEEPVQAPPIGTVLPEVEDALDSPVGARAQQAFLEKAFVDLDTVDIEPLEPAAPIDRAEFESARNSATKWRLRRNASGTYWERMIKDVSIFTIVFALLLLVILQTM